jgi:hypothetical protein
VVYALEFTVKPVKKRKRLMPTSRGQLAQKFLLIHAVFKCLLPVDEYHGNLVVIEAPDFGVGVHVDFTPAKATTLVELNQALLDDFAEMTSLAGIDHDFPRLRHARECSSLGARSPTPECQAETGVESRHDDE